MLSQRQDLPDVWLQLPKWCVENKICETLVARSLTKQLGVQQQQLAQQQERDAQQKQRIAELEQQSAQQQQQLAAASVQAEEAAELRRRVQAFKAQLMQALQGRDM